MTRRCGGCGADDEVCSSWRSEQRKCCPDCQHVEEPPGQLGLFAPRQPSAPPHHLRVVTYASTSEVIRDLPLAALRAAAAAKTSGESWLVAPDFSFAHVTQEDVAPMTGWAIPVARTIQRTRTTP